MILCSQNVTFSVNSFWVSVFCHLVVDVAVLLIHFHHCSLSEIRISLNCFDRMWGFDWSDYQMRNCSCSRLLIWEMFTSLWLISRFEIQRNGWGNACFEEASVHQGEWAETRNQWSLTERESCQHEDGDAARRRRRRSSQRSSGSSDADCRMSSRRWDWNHYLYRKKRSRSESPHLQCLVAILKIESENTYEVLWKIVS